MTPASRAVEAVVNQLDAAGIPATRDAGAFYPQPLGILVGLPELTGWGHGTRTFQIPVHVVSGDPLNDLLAVDRVLTAADAVADALDIAAYRPTSSDLNVNAEPLPAYELLAVVTVTEMEET